MCVCVCVYQCVCVLCSGIHFANKQSSKKKGFSNLRVTIEKTLRETSNLVCLSQGIQRLSLLKYFSSGWWHQVAFIFTWNTLQSN